MYGTQRGREASLLAKSVTNDLQLHLIVKPKKYCHAHEAEMPNENQKGNALAIAYAGIVSIARTMYSLSASF